MNDQPSPSQLKRKIKIRNLGVSLIFVVILTFYFIGFFHFIPQALWLPSDSGTYLKMSYKIQRSNQSFNVKLRSNNMMVQHHSKTSTNIQLEVVSHTNF